jgi:4-alpha-glucanotransferase
MTTLNRRASGILLHPTSLPGRYGLGDLGDSAYEFVDFLQAAGQHYWQILPLGPTGYGESPYQCLSAFAGNTLLISLDRLANRGWLNASDLADTPNFPQRVDYPWVMFHRNELLNKAYQGYLKHRTPADQQAFQAWFSRNAFWAQDFALFMAIKEAYGLSQWTVWQASEANYKQAATFAFQKYQARVEEHLFRQWVFGTQWSALKQYANERDILIVGDLPIFVAHDSSDVWAKRDLFFLDSMGQPPVVTGVPPDSFNPEAGQRWGHPVYRWSRHKETGYQWWINRIQATLEMTDVVRIDHFRAFWDYYEVPAGDLYTTKNGRWMDGPRDTFFEALPAELKQHIIAEDLGDKMEEVVAWRERLGLPGMKILQFAFGGTEAEQARFNPANIESNSVVYTGTHDNNTTVGWYTHEANDWERGNMQRAVERVSEAFYQRTGKPPLDTPQIDPSAPHWNLIRLGMMSGGNTLIIPLQDVLGLGADARQNSPGNPDLSKNWRWRYMKQDLTPELAEWLKTITNHYERG